MSEFVRLRNLSLHSASYCPEEEEEEAKELPGPTQGEHRNFVHGKIFREIREDETKARITADYGRNVNTSGTNKEKGRPGGKLYYSMANLLVLQGTLYKIKLNGYTRYTYCLHSRYICLNNYYTCR